MKSDHVRAMAGALLLVAAGCSQGISEMPNGAVAPTSVDLGNPSDAAVKTYQVTIENLTTGQPISPGVVVTHGRKAGVFEVGALASEGVRMIAENGDPSMAATQLGTHSEVFRVEATTAPVHRVGGPGPASLSVNIEAAADANYLSIAMMLICTNDGFTGVDSLRLPGGFMPEVHMAMAYDAGTEANNEAFDQIVDPCQLAGPPVPGPAVPNGNGRVATATPVSHHPNIQGGGNLTIADHGWSGPIARITVQRLK